MLSPAQIIERLEQIEEDLANRQNEVGWAAELWYRAKRDREKARAEAFLSAEGTVAERQAVADRETALEGKEEEATYESLKAVVRVLETRASIGQTLVRTHSRAA